MHINHGIIVAGVMNVERQKHWMGVIKKTNLKLKKTH